MGNKNQKFVNAILKTFFQEKSLKIKVKTENIFPVFSDSLIMELSFLQIRNPIDTNKTHFNKLHPPSCSLVMNNKIFTKYSFQV